MDKDLIKKYLLTDFSKSLIPTIATHFDNNDKLFDDLWQLIISNEYPICWRAAYLFEHIASNNLSYLEKFIPLIIENFHVFRYDGQKRHTLIFLQLFDLEKFNEGELVNICFNILKSNKDAVAVKMQCIKIIYKISIKNHDLKYELIEYLKMQLQDSRRGYKHSVAMYLKNIQFNNNLK